MIIEIENPQKYVDSKIFNDETGFLFYSENDKLFIAGDVDEKTLLAAWNNHNPVNERIAAKAAKEALLVKLGITEAEAKLLLG